MKHVLVITNNLQQASFRLRIGELVQPLGERGIKLDVQVRSRGSAQRRRLLRSAGDYDSVILQRKLLGASDAHLLRRSAKRIFFDVDDAVMYDQPNAGWLARWRAWRRFLATAANVDSVVAGNAHLAEMFAKQGTKVSVLPTMTDVRRYPGKEHRPTNTPTLVWIGSHSTVSYLRDISAALAEAARQVRGLRLVVVADQPFAESPIPVDFVPWSADAETAALNRGDIGIAPTPRDRWTEGKCGFKIVQYMAAGLPTIASPVGANAQIVVAGQTGLLPQANADWPGAIISLAKDDATRARMGAAALDRAEREYDLHCAVDFWQRLLGES